MTTRYSRNRIYIDLEKQQKIKSIPVLLAGSGLGSVIAECALRLGFEKLTIIDGDKVEQSNLNRQNYISTDIGRPKVEAIRERLKSINPNANIAIHNTFLNKGNMIEHIKGHQLAINALDFTSEAPMLFDKFCQQQSIPVLHPYNLGWTGLLMVVMPDGSGIETITRQDEELNELTVVEYVLNYMKFWGQPMPWFEDIVTKYKAEKGKLPPPQLSIASWEVASMCTRVLFDLATGKEIKKFPEFYMSTIFETIEAV